MYARLTSSVRFLLTPILLIICQFHSVSLRAGEHDFWHKYYPESAKQADLQVYSEYVKSTFPGYDVNTATVNVLLSSAFEKFAQHLAYSEKQQTLTYAQLDQHITHFATYLQSLGLPADSRIAVMMPNIPQYPVVALGIMRAGMTLVPILVPNINEEVIKKKLKEKLDIVKPIMLVTLSTHATIADEVKKEIFSEKNYLEHLVISQPYIFSNLGVCGLALASIKNTLARWKRTVQSIPHNATPLATALEIGHAHRTTFTAPIINADHLAALYFTEGTTSVPKAVKISHKNLVANVLQVHSCIKDTLKEGEEISAVSLPMVHAFGFLMGCLIGPYMGNHQILVSQLNSTEIENIFKKHDITLIFGVDSLFKTLSLSKTFQSLAAKKTLKMTIGGPTPISDTTFDQWKQVTHSSITESYGMSECVGATINPLREERVPSVGIPLPWTQIKIATFCKNSDNGSITFQSEGDLHDNNEILIRGPQVASGYWNNDQETHNTFAEGWLHTGDIGTKNNSGFFTITDRKKDMMLINGQNVFPTNVENKLHHALDIECASVGIPEDLARPDSGDRHILFVVKKSQMTAASIHTQFDTAGLESYEQPHQIIFISRIPKSPIGTILRTTLRNFASSKEKTLSRASSEEEEAHSLSSLGEKSHSRASAEEKSHSRASSEEKLHSLAVSKEKSHSLAVSKEKSHSLASAEEKLHSLSLSEEKKSQ